MRSANDAPRPLVKLLYPGMRIKRWLALLVTGLVLLSLGIADALADLYPVASRAEWVRALALSVFPSAVRGLVFLVGGAALFTLGVRGLYASLADVIRPLPGRPSLLDMLYEFRLRQSGPRIVCIGGGTGMPTVLRGLKGYTSNITAVVTVGDDGGSSGRLRREHGILPPGDFRNSIVALAEAEPLMGQLFQYRFGPGSPLEGHSFGNLFVLAMTGVTGNFEHALRETSRVLAVRGAILPSTLEDVVICARFVDGSEVCGESQVPEERKPIDRILLRPEHPAAQPEAVKAILEADLVVLGPGSLYTSVIPNLLVEGIAKALLQSEAVKVYVCNVATQPGETDGYDVQAHVDALVRHLPGNENPLDFVLAHRAAPSGGSPDPNVELVSTRSFRGGRGGRPTLVTEDVVLEDAPLRHDPERLGEALLRLYYARRRT